MDGTIYLGNTVFEGTKPFLEMLEHNGISYLFLTNNSSRSTKTYIEKLNNMNISAERKHMLTSAHASAAYINERYKNKRTYVLGTDALKEEMREMGINVVTDKPELVLMGFALELTYQDLTTICNYVRSGLPYICTHPDINLPIEDGIVPDIGCNIAFIHASTGRYPDAICGKPSEQMLAAAEAQTSISRKEMLMVGDRLYTDIALRQFGIKTVLVLSGETSIEAAENSEFKADLVLKDIAELHNVLLESIQGDKNEHN